jgi:hypothetical protein
LRHARARRPSAPLTVAADNAEVWEQSISYRGMQGARTSLNLR